jgi:hypothetical protein
MSVLVTGGGGGGGVYYHSSLPRLLLQGSTLLLRANTGTNTAARFPAYDGEVDILRALRLQQLSMNDCWWCVVAWWW